MSSTSINEILQLFLSAPRIYSDWWLSVYNAAPQHILIETSLICFILWLVFVKRTVDPAQISKNETLSDREMNELIESWKPVSIVPAPSETNQVIANGFKVVEKVEGNYLTLSGLPEKVINMSSFDFLSLSNLESIKCVAREALDKYGCGSCGPRGFYGTVDQHLKVEEAVAKFLGTEEAIAYSDGASTVSSCIPAFAKKGDLLVVDEACCESILTGAKLSRSTVLYFKHNDMDDLRKILQDIASDDEKLRRNSTQQRRFIVTEGVFRSTGTICPLPSLLEIKEKFFYRLILDESISFGTMGKTGRGITEHYGLPVKCAEIITVAMDTALASVGGLCVGSRDIVDHQRLSGAGYCFSASAPPFLSAAAVQALKELECRPERIAALHENAKLLWNGLNNISELTILSPLPSPVIHVIVNPKNVRLSAASNELSILYLLSDTLSHAGVGIAVSPFLAISEQSRMKNYHPSLRICANATLTSTEIIRAVDAIQIAVTALLTCN